MIEDQTNEQWLIQNELKAVRLERDELYARNAELEEEVLKLRGELAKILENTVNNMKDKQ